MLLVTGCPRSGTGYAAKLFTHHGVPLGHEQFGPGGTSDWHLADRPFPGEVLHQVRCPKDVIASLETIGERSWRYMRARLGMTAAGRGLEERCRLWLGWTALADEGCDMRYRVEDVSEMWPRIMDYVPTLEPWKGSRLSTEVNSRRHAPLSWRELSQSEAGRLVIGKARVYGYEVNL